MWPGTCLLILAFAGVISAGAELRAGFYSESCPDAETIVRKEMMKAMTADPRSPASVMRLQFHDCFVNGCDASLLLDDTPSMVGEKDALSNVNSLRSFDVIDNIKYSLEKTCPATVSCADIIIMASRDAVCLSGGPCWQVKLGREDSLNASQELSNDIMPSPRSDASSLIDLFAGFNLSARLLVALSGSHTIGKGRCFSILHRLYNQSGTGLPDPAIEPFFRETLEELCPLVGDEEVTGDLDATPLIFDNQYFKDLVAGRGFLNSDQTLYTNPLTRPYVKEFSEDDEGFFDAFVEGMIRMGDLQSGLPGQVRHNCRVVNFKYSDFLGPGSASGLSVPLHDAVNVFRQIV